MGGMNDESTRRCTYGALGRRVEYDRRLRNGRKLDCIEYIEADRKIYPPRFASCHKYIPRADLKDDANSILNHFYPST